MTSLLNIFKKRCKAYTANGIGERCKRSPEKGSDYCWQHQPTVTSLLLEQGMPEPLLSEVLEYVGEEYNTENWNIIHDLNVGLRPVIEWYGSQGFKILFKDLPEPQIRYVIDVYDNRLKDDSVDVDYIIELDKKNGNILPEVTYDEKNGKEVHLLLPYLKVNETIFNPYTFFSQSFTKIVKDRRTGDAFVRVVEKLLSDSSVKLYLGVEAMINNNNQSQYYGCVADSTHAPISLSSDILINNYPHSRYFEYSTRFISVNYSLNTKKTIQHIYEGKNYNIWLTNDKWFIITFSVFMKNILNNEIQHQNDKPIKFLSGCKGWYQELLDNVRDYTPFDRTVLNPNEPYNDLIEAYDDLIEVLKNNLSEKFKDEIEHFLNTSSRVLIESAHKEVFGYNYYTLLLNPVEGGIAERTVADVGIVM
jgi:hypothetical protein